MNHTVVLWVIILAALAIFAIALTGTIALRNTPETTKAKERRRLRWLNGHTPAPRCGKPTTWASAPCVRDVAHVGLCYPDGDRVDAVEEWERWCRDAEPAPPTRWPGRP